MQAQPDRSMAKKAEEEYRRRYEDQSLKAFESHSTAAGNTLLAAYLIWLAPGQLKLPDEPGLQSVLMAAAYAYLTYNVCVIGKLIKRLYRNAESLRRLQQSSVKFLEADSHRLLLAGPLGPFQLTVTRFARYVANKRPGPLRFALLFAGLVAVVALIAGLILAPLARRAWALTATWPLSGRILLEILVLAAPIFQVTGLLFRFCRPYMAQLQKDAKSHAFSLVFKLTSRASNYFDQDQDDEQ